MKTIERHLEILLIESDIFEMVKIRKIFRRENFEPNLNVVPDEKEAFDFISQRGDYKSAPRPDVVLLDAESQNGKSTRILKRLKADPTLKHVPVVVLSGKGQKDNPAQQFQLHENCHLKKWNRLKDFLSLIKAIEDTTLSSIKSI